MVTTTNNVIALCHILNEYKEFHKRLSEFVYSEENYDFISKLRSISQGDICLGAKKEKKFYRENQAIIDTINQYTTISSFVYEYYIWYHYQINVFPFPFLYDYILNHKQDIKQILELLAKLKELGFEKFTFNEEEDFTKETYNASSVFADNYHLVYVDQIEVIPSYNRHIYYRTSFSNYKIHFNIILNRIQQYGKKITLNSLLFDPNRLPQAIDKENTFDVLLRLKNEQKETSECIRSSVNLRIAIDDLKRQCDSASLTISSLKDFESKEQAQAILLSIQEEIKKLEVLSVWHDHSILQKESSLTPEILDTEQVLYLKRRKAID